MAELHGDDFEGFAEGSDEGGLFAVDAAGDFVWGRGCFWGKKFLS